MTFVITIIFILIFLQQLRICFLQNQLLSIINSFEIIEKNTNLLVRLKAFRDEVEKYEDNN